MSNQESKNQKRPVQTAALLIFLFDEKGTARPASQSGSSSLDETQQKEYFDAKLKEFESLKYRI